MIIGTTLGNVNWQQSTHSRLIWTVNELKTKLKKTLKWRNRTLRFFSGSYWNWNLSGGNHQNIKWRFHCFIFWLLTQFCNETAISVRLTGTIFVTCINKTHAFFISHIFCLFSVFSQVSHKEYLCDFLWETDEVFVKSWH